MRNKTRLLPALAFGLFCIALLASAAEDAVFVLDASNSMNKLLAVKTRIDAAKDALTELVSGIQPGDNVGLMVYGHRINQKNEVESCQDIELLFPVAPLDEGVRARMLSAIEAITAQGKTPLADSLVAAANALAQTGRGGGIVLISDGEGNCGGQQLVVAQMIATMDPPITVHVIGLDIEQEAGGSLQDIVTITGGSYWNVAEASGLLEALFALAGDTVATSQLTSGARIGIPAEFACYGVTNVIHGTEGDDVLYGTSANDLILGYGGDDFLIGLDGNDLLIGGSGDDILEGGSGEDVLDGGEGNDLIFGGPDNDIVCGGPGNDSLEGDAGNDILDGSEGNDVLLGGHGKDVLYCADAADVLLEGDIVYGTFADCPVCTAPCPPPPLPCRAPVTPPCPPSAPPEAIPCPTPVPVRSDCNVQGLIKSVNEGEILQLHGTASDTDCNITQVFWEVSAGSLDDAASLDPVFTAPMIPGCNDMDVTVTLTAVDSCGASACDSFVLRIVNVNRAPTIDAGPEIWINEGSAVAILAQAHDPDGDMLVVQWSSSGNLGSFENSGALTPVFVAPLIDNCDGIAITLTVTAVDPCGATACDTVIVRVRNANAAPIVDLGPDFALDEGSAIRLTPVVSDPECEALTYCWSTTAPGSLDRPGTLSTVFSAPWTDLCDGETVTLSLTVTDPCGLSATDSVTVRIRNVNSAPTVELGASLCVLEGGSLVLSPAVFDPEGDRLAYVWTTTAGQLSDRYSISPVFGAPMIDACEGQDVVVTLTVTDPCGLSASDSVVIRVENANRPPSVHADP